MREESTHFLVERSFSPYSFPKLIVMEFRGYFHCSSGDLGKDEKEKTKQVHGEKVSTGGKAQS